MRVFTTTLCKDDKTGYQMILSECSYDEAMLWLEAKAKKYNCTAISAEVVGPYIEVPVRNKDTSDLMRMFYYDEKRGYLLGE